MLGDYAVGKTSLIKVHFFEIRQYNTKLITFSSLWQRYTEGVYTPNYRLTIGVDFAVKTIQLDEKTNITLQVLKSNSSIFHFLTLSLKLWDVSGHERHGHMLSIYVRYAIAGIIVFDLSRPSTLEAVKQWRDDVNKKVVLANDEPIPLLLLANKCDLPEVKVDADMLNEFAAENGFIGWFAVSAQDNINLSTFGCCWV